MLLEEVSNILREFGFICNNAETVSSGSGYKLKYRYKFSGQIDVLDIAIDVPRNALVDSDDFRNRTYVEFYFVGVNLFAIYSLKEITTHIIIEQLDKFLKSDEKYLKKRKFIFRNANLELIL